LPDNGAGELPLEMHRRSCIDFIVVENVKVEGAAFADTLLLFFQDEFQLFLEVLV
jgi:hypothetical protein